jgi:excisionase family DNA binding protein
MQETQFSSDLVLLTISEVSDMFGVHANTIRRWNNRGYLRSYRLGNRGDRRFLKEQVDALLSINQVAKEA